MQPFSRLWACDRDGHVSTFHNPTRPDASDTGINATQPMAVGNSCGFESKWRECCFIITFRYIAAKKIMRISHKLFATTKYLHSSVIARYYVSFWHSKSEPTQSDPRKAKISDSTRLDPIRPKPWANPIHVHLWHVVHRSNRNKLSSAKVKTINDRRTQRLLLKIASNETPCCLP